MSVGEGGATQLLGTSPNVCSQVVFPVIVYPSFADDVTVTCSPGATVPSIVYVRPVVAVGTTAAPASHVGSWNVTPGVTSIASGGGGPQVSGTLPNVCVHSCVPTST